MLVDSLLREARTEKRYDEENDQEKLLRVVARGYLRF